MNQNGLERAGESAKNPHPKNGEFFPTCAARTAWTSGGWIVSMVGGRLERATSTAGGGVLRAVSYRFNMRGRTASRLYFSRIICSPARPRGRKASGSFSTGNALAASASGEKKSANKP